MQHPEYEKLVEAVSVYMPKDVHDHIRQAYEFAAKAHSDQKRKSGEDYVTHPLEVATIIAKLHLDLFSVLAAVLHDTVEDTAVTVEDIHNTFGQQVAELVDGLTKISKVEFRSSQEKMAENFRKMILAMAKDIRVIVIKLADRLHNMRTIQSMPKPKAMLIAQETLDIYAPLANRLGIFGIKSELEDISLRVLKEDVYTNIRNKIAAKKEARDTYIEEVKAIISHELKKYNFVGADVTGRPKNFYSIYKKMMHREAEFEDIHDLFAFRIVVDSIKDCYEALGIVHAMWKPMPGRFKDYVAMPKANMYQSLHTTVIRPNGEPIEIQIRTRDMHRVCEYGIAAHWTYKEGSKMDGQDIEKFSWLRRIVQWQSELKDPDEFLEAVKVDLFDEEIFVFSPKGDVFSLPHGATALDFAFAVHTTVGLHTIGAKVNSVMVPIKKQLKSGDIVKILTSENQNPKQDWLSFVTTSKARSKIRSALRSSQREEGKQLGRDLLEKELAKRGVDFEYLRKHGLEDQLIKAARESRIDDVLIAIGYGKADVVELVEKLMPSKIEDTSPQSVPLVVSKAQGAKSEKGISVSGIDNVMLHFAKCCMPLPGESITGFITRGKGVTIHRSDCVRANDLDNKRKVDVSWGKETGTFSTFLRITTYDRIGVLADVSQIMQSCGVSISSAEIRTGNAQKAELDFELSVKDREQLEILVRKIESLTSVLSVQRRSSLKKKDGLL
jgi:GTP diphosphokinase / guanosine-3',5'-bis(diphosphate) 3'-diphosphatase